MPDYAAAYATARTRLSDLARDLDADALSARVPACPDWTVKDVLAHVTGIAADMTAGRLEGVGSDEWTSAQVEPRRATPLPDILAEWESASASVEPMVAAAPPSVGASLIGDLMVHEQDVRGAVDQPGGDDGEDAAIALDYYARRLGSRIKAARLPALRLRSADREWIAGEGEPQATVEAAPFALFRALTGRRTAAQIGALSWDGDPVPWLGVFSAYGTPAADLSY